MKFEDLREYAKEHFVPIVRVQTAEILKNEIAKKNPTKILEIGTAIGYSGILMLKNSNQSQLVTIEKNLQMVEIARNNFVDNQVYDRVTILQGDAGEILKDLDDKFDFIFLDGPKGQYKNYLPDLKRLLNKDGILFTDNVLFEGLVKNGVEIEKIEKKHRTIVRNLREYLKLLNDDKQLSTKLLDIEDGITVSVKG